jgi:hypothetical protein
MTPPNGGTQAVSTPPIDTRRVAIGLGAFVVVAVACLTWAKWSPYLAKTQTILDTDSYPGSSILDEAGRAKAGPSLAGGWDFTVAYFKAIWQALVAALLIAAGVLALLPRRRVVRALSAGRFPTLTAGLWSIPSMMCTCCTAPVTTALCRSGVPTSSALAYWVGNPVLNPAVIVFMAILLPWQWVATRVILGALLVFGVTAVVAKVVSSREQVAPEAVDAAEEESPGYFRSLLRLAVVLVPEYLVVVFLVGTFRGWLFPFDGGAGEWAALVAIGAAVVGTLVVIPTAGEIPILTGLAAAGAGAGVIGAGLIVLPAVCLPSMVMVGRALGWRVTAAMGAGVALTGVLGAALLPILGG